jgi:capsular polysaccharide transport system permease protein
MDATLSPPLAATPRLRHLRVVAALMLREMDTRFGRAAGGYLWAVAQPLGTILLLSVAFSLMLRSPPMGTSFLLFYATGIIPFNMYRAISTSVAGAVATNRGLLAYPVVSALDAVLAKFVLELCTATLVAAIVFGAVILFFELHVVLDLGAIVTGFGLAALLGLGVGTVNCVLFGFFPTWRNVWRMLSRPLFLLSGVFFLFESLPGKLQAALWWNPLAHVLAVMRSGFYGTYEPQFVSYPYVLGWGLALFFVGGYLIRRHQAYLIEQ